MSKEQLAEVAERALSELTLQFTELPQTRADRGNRSPDGPAVNFLFQDNLQRNGHAAAELQTQIRTTVLHEIGH